MLEEFKNSDYYSSLVELRPFIDIEYCWLELLDALANWFTVRISSIYCQASCQGHVQLGWVRIKAKSVKEQQSYCPLSFQTVVNSGLWALNGSQSWSDSNQTWHTASVGCMRKEFESGRNLSWFMGGILFWNLRNGHFGFVSTRSSAFSRGPIRIHSKYRFLSFFIYWDEFKYEWNRSRSS